MTEGDVSLVIQLLTGIRAFHTADKLIVDENLPWKRLA